MRLMDDKELLLLLWDVYDEYASVKESFDWFFPIKWDGIMKESSLLIEGKEVKAPMYNFYIMRLPHQLLRPCKNALKKSKEVVSKLEEIKMLQQFKTAEIESFHVADEELDKYLGVYSSEQTQIKLTIAKDYGKLVVHPTGQPSLPLAATEKDKFEFAGGELVLEFNLSDSTIVSKQDGKVLNFKREE